MQATTRPTLLATVVLACGVVSCIESESGVGQSPPNSSSGAPSSSAGSSDDADGGSGVDDTSDADPSPPAAKSYFIAESMDFTGNGCENPDVNEVTDSLHGALDDDGWVGTRVTEDQTRPADFIDSAQQSYGVDHTKSDAVSLAVYAGHGLPNKIGWGTSDDTPGIAPAQKRCIAEFSEDIRLGSFSGGWAKAVALMTSCTGSLACYETTLGKSDATQVFAFNNSPAIWGNAARRFYRKTDRMSNRDAWIAAMDNKPGFGKNSPVVYTRGTSHEQVLEIHRSARLAQIDQTPSQQGTGWYAYTWVDHGPSETCASLPDVCVGVDE